MILSMVFISFSGMKTMKRVRDRRLTLILYTAATLSLMFVFLPHVSLVTLPELHRLIRVEGVQHLAYVKMIPLQQPKEGVDLVDGKFGLRVISSLAAHTFMLRIIRE